MAARAFAPKVADAQPLLPQGTLGPFVNDDFGRVAVASIAVTAPGYSMGEMRVSLKEMRDRLIRTSRR